MGLLVGLPLGIFKILLSLVLLALRFALPLLVLFFLWRAVKKNRAGASQPPDEPEFNGLVYTVDYKIVDEEEE